MGVDDLLPGEMKEVETNVNGSKVLIVRNSAGKYYALSPKCPHFGAPMVSGALVGNRVLCPWHNASFSITTGTAFSPAACKALCSCFLFLVRQRARCAFNGRSD
jgi:nitrite reductase/ring-hydroxylating ferredoxin subunit